MTLDGSRGGRITEEERGGESGREERRTERERGEIWREARADGAGEERWAAAAGFSTQ